MRKAFFYAVILTLCLSLWGCASPDTFDAAVEMSQKMIHKLNSDSDDPFVYSYTYPDSREAFTVMLQPKGYPFTYTEKEIKAISKEVFKDISHLFSSFDTAVVIAIMSPEDELLRVYTKSDF